MNPQHLRMPFPGDGYGRWQRGIFAGRPLGLKGSQPSSAFHSLQVQESGVREQEIEDCRISGQGEGWKVERRKEEGRGGQG